MAHVRRHVLALLLGWAVGLPTGPVAQAGERARAPAKQPAFQATGLVALSGGTLLAWGADGRLQVGSPEGGWGPVLQLPMTYVTHIVPEGEGALLGGSQFPKGGIEHAVAVAVDARGEVRTRWQGGEGLFHWVARANGKRWAISLDEWVELLPDGSVQKVETVPSLSQLLLGPGGQQVLCTPANRTLAHAALASCGSSGAAPWSVRGDWERPPLACGAWLVTKEGAELVVRSLTSGQELARRAVPGGTLACHAPDRLLAADKQVRELALPSLEERWKQSCGSGSVVALAPQEESVACLDARGRVKRLKDRAAPAPHPD